VDVQPSGNSVNLPQEMSKTGEIKRMYELNTGMVKAFHRMMLLTVRR
jgi:flagellar basal-body rod protein FlgB